MVADILKEKEWAEVRAKEADAQAEADAKGRRGSEVMSPSIGCRSTVALVYGSIARNRLSLRPFVGRK